MLTESLTRFIMVFMTLTMSAEITGHLNDRAELMDFSAPVFIIAALCISVESQGCSFVELNYEHHKHYTEGSVLKT